MYYSVSSCRLRLECSVAALCSPLVLAVALLWGCGKVGMNAPSEKGRDIHTLFAAYSHTLIAAFSDRFETGCCCSAAFVPRSMSALSKS